MKQVYQAENVFDAHLVKGVLEQAGIPAHVSGEFLPGALGELPAFGLVAVQVEEKDAERARRVIEEMHNADASDADDDIDDPTSQLEA